MARPDPERDQEAPYEHVVPRQVELRDPSSFDRIAFAMRALDRLKPKRLTVAVYSSVSSLRIESGEDLKRRGARWAIVGIPPHASREHIAYALVELAGIAHVPYAVASLLAADVRDRRDVRRKG